MKYLMMPCCPWCPFQCPDVWGFVPPTCAAGGTWIWCGWRGVGDGAPPNVLELFNALLPYRPEPTEEVSLALLNPLEYLSARLCVPLPPPYPFSRTTVLVPIPSLPTGAYFRGRPARPLPVGFPCSRTRKTPKRCQVPVPCPLPPFLCHARGPFTP